MSNKELTERRKRGLEADHLQMIEGNPLDAEDLAMFEMFDRDGYTDKQRRAYIMKDARKRQEASDAAE